MKNNNNQGDLLRFGTIDTPFIDPASNVSKTDMLYGAWVAIAEFYPALIRYGNFDEYHFFSSINTLDFKKKLPQELTNNNRVKFKKIKDIPFYLGNTTYTTFFTCRPLLANLAYLRSYHACRYFPICGLTYTISYRFFLKDVFFRNLISELYPFDSIICTSNGVLKAFQNLNAIVRKSFLKEKKLALDWQARLDHLPLGVDADRYGKTDKLEARKILGLPKNKVIILYFGRFSVYDKMDLYPLLVAFKNLKNKNIILLLAGKDNPERYAAKVRKLAKDMGIMPQVVFRLDPSLKRKYLLYSASDIFVSPSDNIQESFGLTVLEAMASGLPVVVSDWDGYKDIVVHDKTGFKIPTYWMRCDEDICSFSQLFSDFYHDHLALSQTVCVDIKKMTDYLSILVKHKELRKQFGREAQKRVLEKYDWRILIPAYERLWRQLSLIAKNSKINREKTKIFVPSYFTSFRHYASKIIALDTKITITGDGILAVKTKSFLSIPLEIQYLVSMRIIFLILTFVLARNTSTVKEIYNYIKSILNKSSADTIQYNIMWLLKKNLLMLA